MNLTRRKFLKVAAATGAAGMASTRIFSPLSANPDTPPDPPKYVNTFCELCFWNCGVIAKVSNGKVIKLEGNPLAIRNRGRLCGRGNAGLGLLYDPDRLKEPMINTGERGNPRWKTASWDEALGFTAEKMLRIKETYGPEAVSLISHGKGGSWWKHMLKAYGTENLSAPSFTQCRGSRDTGFTLTFGSGAGSPEYFDFRNSRFIVLIGSHFGENAHNALVQDLMDGISGGAKLVVLDPRLSNIASKADWWLPVKPATDIALMLAWMHVIINEELYDREYIAKYATGLKRLKEEVRENTPEWAAVETEIPARTIVEVARAMAREKPNVCIGAGRFNAWYGDDSQRSRAIALLNALMGSWGREGGYYFPAPGGVAGYPGTPSYPSTEKDELTGDFPYALPPTTTAIREATITGKPYPVKGWIAYGSNLLKTLPNSDETIKAINNLDLMVAVDVLPYEVINYSDVVLPECTYLERYDDLNLTRMKEFEVAIRQPAVKPLFKSKPSWWIVKELGKKLGLAEYFPWQDAKEYLKERCAQDRLNFHELQKRGVIRSPHRTSPFITAENQPSFDTDSGRIELYSEALKDEGYDPVPKFTKHAEPPEGYFRLIFGRSPLHTFSRTTNNFMLTDLRSENELWINTAKARELNLKHGEYVGLVNQDGVKAPTTIKVKVTERIRGDCVYMYHGFGVISSALTRANRKGISTDSLITSYKTEPLTGTLALRGNFVKIIKPDQAGSGEEV